MDTNESLSHSKWECKYHVVLSRSVAAEHCTSSCDVTWGKCLKIYS